MPGGGVMSAQTAEAMIQRMPDPGVRLAPLTDAARKQYGLDPKMTGALVASVEADCEARDLGIVAGDVVTGGAGSAGGLARRCAARGADSARSAAPVPGGSGPGQERRALGFAVDGPRRHVTAE